MIEAIGMWGQKWVEGEPSLENLDPELLMWDMRRNLDIGGVRALCEQVAHAAARSGAPVWHRWG